MAVEPFSLLVLFSATIILGYIGSLIFDRTGISDVLWLLLLGILVGPVFNIVDRQLFIQILPLLSSLALLMILFSSGLNMNFYQTVRGFSRGMLLAVLGVLANMAFVGAVSYYFFNVGIWEGILLGAIVGGTSSPVVLSLVDRLKIGERPKTTLKLETIFTDPLVIVVSIAIIGLITKNGGSPVSSIFSAFSVGAVIGLFAGVAWLVFLHKVKGKPFDYMLTLAVLFVLYVLTESVGGSGSIASLVFGIVLGNGRTFSSILRLDKQFSVTHLFKAFQEEATFFIRSFFFVYLGIIVSIKPDYAIFGTVIAAVLIVSRFIVVRISTIGMGLSSAEKRSFDVMVPRGLSAAVLSQLPSTMGITGGQMFSDAVFVVIVATIIYTTIAVRVSFGGHSNAPKDKKIEKERMQAEKEAAKKEKK